MTDVFGEALLLLRRNVIIIVPSLIVALASAIAAYALSAAGYLSWQFFGDLNAEGPGAFWQFFGTIVALGLRILGALIAIAFTTGMAGAAWEHGTAALSDGLAAFRRGGLQLLVALAILFLMGLAASALVVPTFGISLLAYMVFMIYAMSGVVVGNRAAQDAIVDSVRMAASNFWVSLVLVLLIVVLAAAGGLVGYVVGQIPFLGEVISWIVMEAVVAYATLVVVGEYLKLRQTLNEAS